MSTNVSSDGDMEKKGLPTAAVEEGDSAPYTGAQLADAEEHKASIVQAIKENKQAVLWCIFAIWTSLLVSFDANASGNALGIVEFRKDFGSYYQGGWVLAAQWQSLFWAGPSASSVVSALFCGQISDYIGRKWTIVIALVISYVAITLEIVASGQNGNGIFFAGRFLNGFVVGLLITVCSSYIGEIAPLALRGLMTAMIAFVYALAPLIVSLIVNSTGTQTTPWAYRTVFITQYGFVGVATLLIPWMPESPWWLASKGRDEQALKTLRKLGSATDADATRKLDLIKVTLEKARQETEGATYIECFRYSNLRRTMVSTLPLSIQAMGGILFINGYLTYYAQLAGYSTPDSYHLSIIYNVVSICGCVCSWFVIDKVGRRNLTLGGTAALTVVLLIAGGLATTKKTPDIRGVIAMMMIYTFVYSITIGSTAYTILTENATARLRVKTIGIGVAFQGVWYTVMNIALPYLFNPNEANLGAKVSFIFGGISVLSCIYLYFQQPETAHRSYEELDLMYAAKVPAREFKKYITEVQMQISNGVKGEESI
ncbi:hypothetical protein BP6252_10797 [Coleophoma cylindrospora]|uniref:Major facilitator superfamily (MFS) profile domain-containing protein n=1 Tax=Coleophoma cylindrospora TaxID=1849047 RepID=A0A3D8QN69_9HELO|nr:hypothetical protein BP6252_10797 [Coleophoma cylindrospora]